MVTEYLLKTVISCFVCTMQENQFLLFLNHLRLPYSIPKSFALLLAFHIARHTFACVAIANKVSMESIAKMLGHTDIRTTKIYARLMDRTVSEEMNVLRQKFSV